VLRRFLRPVVAIAALAGLAAYATIMLRGPQGLTALAEKHREMSVLEEQNANLQRDIEAKKERIERLKKDPSLQELEVRKRLKMQREGDTEFILSDPVTTPDPAKQK
jgi:cell division protein FtsB